ncbi:MAG TPA: BA14K family protein [Devosia sp.]
MVHHLSRQSREPANYGAELTGGKEGGRNLEQGFAVWRSAMYLQKGNEMKKTAIVLAAAATFLTSLSISAPVSAASWDWGFSSPFFSFHHDRSIGSRHLSGRDSVRVGPFRWSGGFGLGRDHVERCYSRYRSYDSLTDTYMTFGGERRRCKL